MRLTIRAGLVVLIALGWGIVSEPACGQERTPETALAGLDVADGLEVTLFAAEPMLLNPTNLDIDHRGRIWVCEVVNYRHFRNTNNPVREAGDRILIFEDTDGDGRADRRKVFYQGRDVDSAMGICVLGNRVIVSCSPNVIVFTDEDGDDRPDRKEYLFTKTGQQQHDHSAHSFVFGPDGKLYWNFGNTGKAVHDRNGKLVVDRNGHPVVDNGKPYYGGMVFRCNPDGSDFEVLGHNFRNNYEVAVDSFGTLWQSDNDDDGNRGVRINYVMEFGNYGYRDEMTGAAWQTPRTGMHPEIPLRHWHQNDPGVVPNLLQTGAGSPTGICVYEGTLLPARFRNQVIHCDAGPNVVRAYPVEVDGAGYRARIENLVVGARDQWFRPADVCVAPDGSLFVTDWYDPGVGGHRMGDVNRGRIFRIAPPGTPYRVPQVDVSTLEGAVEALASPNLATRYLAWTALQSRGKQAEPALRRLFEQSDNPRLRARALWLLGLIEDRGTHYVERAVEDPDPDIRVTGIRLARRIGRDTLPLCRRLAGDESAQVRRECAIALRFDDRPEAAQVWAELALRHDGHDRWYLEALGIGADLKWEACLSAWLDRVDDWNTPAGRDIIWRSRAPQTPLYLARIVSDSRIPTDQLPRYLRAFDFQSGPHKAEALAQLATVAVGTDAQRRLFVATEALNRLDPSLVRQDAKLQSALDHVLDASRGTLGFVRLMERFAVAGRWPELLQLAQAHPEDQLGVEAMRVLLDRGRQDLIRQALLEHSGDKRETALATIRALGTSADGRALELLRPLVLDGAHPTPIRREAVRAVTRSRKGAMWLAKRAEAGQLDKTLHQAAGAALHGVRWRDVKEIAARLFPLPAAKNTQPLPPIERLVSSRGDARRGRTVFEKTGTCSKCHVVDGAGKQVGPDLSEIGRKLSRQALFESILFPSAGISHNYESYVVVLDDGNVITGILVSETPDAISLKTEDAIVRTIPKSRIEEQTKSDVSLMPADLAKTMSAQELIDLVEYLTTLRKASASSTRASGS